ncbi:MAG: polysaccharide deacetylase family protein [Bacteroidales bacterium]|nr:polysaccharide deacetylase family protein [Bacteroidales bacterium]
MRHICFYFQIHQPFRFRTYRFFDIGHDSYYYDDFSNRSILHKIAKKCYLKMNDVLLQLLKTNDFKVAFSISGSALDQFEQYAPEVIESFKKLAKTGKVEFLGETYSHSLVSLRNENEFKKQVAQHSAKIKELFDQSPEVFRNTELIYSDFIGEQVYNMGFKAMLTEGAKHILGWKSPNYLYCNTLNPKLKLLLRNYKLSDDIAFRFSNQSWNEWPLTADKFVGWLNNVDPNEEVINLFMDYETFGEHQWESTGIFDFMKALPKAILKNTNFKFATPSEVAKKHQPVAQLSVPYPISWADEERDLTAWLGNNLQREAFENLYSLSEEVNICEDETILKDWQKLQTSDHFYYMCTKFFADGAVHMYFNPYGSPYDAFINYMNVLSDFAERVKAIAKKSEIKLLSPEAVDEEIKKHEELLKQLIETKKQKKETTVAKKKTTETPVKTAEKTKTEKSKQTSSVAKKAEKPSKKEATVTKKTVPTSKKEEAVVKKAKTSKNKNN